MNIADVTLRPWAEADLPLLEKLLGDADMMQHLGGPETPEQIRQRHGRYLDLPETDHMFTTVLDEAVGSIGYWERNWRDRLVYEMGWFVLPAYQGRGIATQAGEAAIQQARQDHRYQFMHAFPGVDNPASNAICRKLGFTLLEECQFDYPPGHFLQCNDWQLDLFEM
jgi:RimJ/RimL family protein N-acetyltransferase